ncbi:MAG TPA: cytochrome c [Arachidicoccus sp.]
MKCLSLFIITLIFLFNNHLYAQASADAGKTIFTARCTACHGIGKQVVGPDLKDVENLRSEQWIIKFVHSSQSVIKSGDTAAVALFGEFNKTVMPDHPDLSDNDIKNIIAYIKQQSESVAKNTGNTNLNLDRQPYPNSEGGFFHRVLFLDLPGNHTPLKLTDYTAWMTIAVAVIFLVVALVARVRMEDTKEKEGENKQAEDNNSEASV